MPENDAPGGGWAFLLGIITAILQFILNIPFDPGAFGFSRWLWSFFIVSLPVIIPLLLYLVLIIVGFIHDEPNFAGFTLSFLIPPAIVNAISWASYAYPVPLVLVPILWTCIAVGVPFLIRFINYENIILTILASLGILIIPLAAATSYWAYFSHEAFFGTLFLVTALIPMLSPIVLSYIQILRD